MADDSPVSIFVIDDDADMRFILREILVRDHYRVEAVGSAKEALNWRDWSAFSVILLDRRLPDGTAEEMLPRLNQLAPDAAVIVLTGYADVEEPFGHCATAPQTIF